MLTNQINEITVWLDSLEDQNVDTSSLRYLCFYNYLSSLLAYDFFLDSDESANYHVLSAPLYNYYWLHEVAYGFGWFEEGDGGRNYLNDFIGPGCWAYDQNYY